MALQFLETNEVKLKPAAFVGILIVLIIVGYAFGVMLGPKEVLPDSNGENNSQPAFDCSSCQPIEIQKKSLSFEEGLLEIKNAIAPYNSLDELIQNSNTAESEIFSNKLLELEASLDDSAADSAAIKGAADVYIAIFNALKVENDLANLKSQAEGYGICTPYGDYIAAVNSFKEAAGKIKSQTLPEVRNAVESFNSKYPGKIALAGFNETITVQVENKINELSDASGFVIDEKELENLKKSFCGGEKNE